MSFFPQENGAKQPGLRPTNKFAGVSRKGRAAAFSLRKTPTDAEALDYT